MIDINMFGDNYFVLSQIYLVLRNLTFLSLHIGFRQIISILIIVSRSNNDFASKPIFSSEDRYITMSQY